MAIEIAKGIAIFFFGALVFITFVVSIGLAVSSMVKPKHKQQTTDIHHKRELGPQQLV